MGRPAFAARHAGPQAESLCSLTSTEEQTPPHVDAEAPAARTACTAPSPGTCSWPCDDPPARTREATAPRSVGADWAAFSGFPETDPFECRASSHAARRFEARPGFHTHPSSTLCDRWVVVPRVDVPQSVCPFECQQTHSVVSGFELL